MRVHARCISSTKGASVFCFISEDHTQLHKSCFSRTIFAIKALEVSSFMKKGHAATEDTATQGLLQLHKIYYSYARFATATQSLLQLCMICYSYTKFATATQDLLPLHRFATATQATHDFRRFLKPHKICYSYTRFATATHKICLLKQLLASGLNPFTATAFKISGPKDARTRLQTVYFPVL